MVSPVESLGGAPLFRADGRQPEAPPIAVPTAAQPAPQSAGGRAFLSITELGGRATIAASALPPSETTVGRIATSFAAARRDPPAGQTELTIGVFGARSDTPAVTALPAVDVRQLNAIAGSESGGAAAPPSLSAAPIGEIARTIFFEATINPVQDLATGTFGGGERVQLSAPASAIGGTTLNFAVAPELFNLRA